MEAGSKPRARRRQKKGKKKKTECANLSDLMEGRNRSRLLPKIRALDTELVVTFVPTESRINEKKGEKREGKKRKSRHGKLA